MTQIKKHGEITSAARLIADWRSMIIVHAIYEHGPVRYRDLDDMLGFSPTILSGKLAQLTGAGVIERSKEDGAKEVQYVARPFAVKMVRAYHLLEDINDNLKSDK